MSTNNIPVLPEEVLDLIFSHLEYPGNPFFDAHVDTTLATLCRVNKQCCRLARPILYRTIFPPAGRQRESKDTIRLLLRTLVEKPDLAKLVETVWIEAGQVAEDEDGNDEDEDEEPAEDDAMESFEAAAAPLILLNDANQVVDRVVEGLRKNKEGANLVLLLVLATNLQTLHLQLPYELEDLPITQLLQHLGNLPKLANSDPLISEKILPNLKTLDLSWYDTEGSLDIVDVKYMPRIRTLHTLQGFMVSITSEEMRNFEEHPCNLRVLRLQQSLVDAEGLRDFMIRCPHLEVLDIEYGSAVVGDCELRWDGIGDALRQYGRRLKSIKLDPTDAFAYECSNDETSRPSLGALATLTALEQLSVPAVALVGEDDDLADDYPTFDVPNLVDNLPTSLRKLEILHVHDDNVEELEKQLPIVMASEKLSKLSCVRINQQHRPVFQDFEDSTWHRQDSGRNWLVFKRAVP